MIPIISNLTHSFEMGWFNRFNHQLVTLMFHSTPQHFFPKNLQVLRWHGWNLTSFTHRTALCCGSGHLHLRHCPGALVLPNSRPFRGGNPPSNSHGAACNPTIFHFKDDFPKVLEVWSPTRKLKVEGWRFVEVGRKLVKKGGFRRESLDLHSLKLRGFESISRTWTLR